MNLFHGRKDLVVMLASMKDSDFVSELRETTHRESADEPGSAYYENLQMVPPSWASRSTSAWISNLAV